MPRHSDDERDVLRERVVELRVAGETPAQIAAQLQISTPTVYRLIEEAAEESSARLAQLVDQRRMEQDQRVEYLLSLCMKRVRERFAAGLPIEKDLKNAVALFDRQARLLGLDVARGPGGHNKLDWLETAPFEAVVTEAERMGLIRPGEFQTPGTF